MKMKLTYEELLTVAAEVEAVINSRPLTYVYEDDAEKVLTPSHLYCGRRLLDEQDDSSNEDIPEIKNTEMSLKRWNHMNKIINRFWKRWQKEYLINLRETHKLKTRKKSLEINKGDVVCIFEEGLKRRFWKIGKILNVIKGKDDIVRGAEVQIFSDKKGKGIIS